jgi:diaminohydroxyphosphoribosylaminopyrimidine deaminase/5-amino-6-(5-phosphoribosylamino)uracil reductase
VEVDEIPARGGTRPGLDLEEALRNLGRRGITSLLVEGGGELEGSFLDLQLGDRLVLYLAPKILGGRDARPWIAGEGVATAASAVRLGRVRSSRLGDGWLIEGSLEYSGQPSAISCQRRET